MSNMEVCKQLTYPLHQHQLLEQHGKFNGNSKTKHTDITLILGRSLGITLWSLANCSDTLIWGKCANPYINNAVTFDRKYAFISLSLSYVCVYVCIHVCVNICFCIYVYMFASLCVYICMHVYVFVCVCVGIYIYIYICICAFVCV